MKNIVIFPGSFDPIHTGHLLMAEKASVLLNADVIFVPAVVSIWKDESAPFIDKVNMIELAIKNNPRFSVSLYEGTTGKESNYTIDTIKHFKEQLVDANLFLLIGEDQVNKFHLWKDASQLANLTQIIFFERPDNLISFENVKLFNMKEIEGILCDASSSNIRNLIDLNTPNEVIDYISNHNLYYMRKISSLINEERLKHSIEVAKLARTIAFSNKLDISSAYIAGLLHDVGKHTPREEQAEILKEHYPEYANMPIFSYHQFVGEYLAKTIFNIKDEDILNAIKFHATGSANMSKIAKIVYSSDKIEPTRGFDSTDLINSCLKDCEQGFIDVLADNREYLLHNKKDINNKLTDECFKQYLNLD